MPVPSAASEPDEQRRRGAEDRARRLVRESPGPTTDATNQPTKALASIIPSMPMLTTPERSFITPHSAPSASGAASGEDDRRR